MKTALTIGGSDPTGGAGIQADLKTFHSLGVYGLSIPTAMTAQNTGGITGIFNVTTDFFAQQLDTLISDIQPDAVKTGMLSSEDLIIMTAEKIRDYSLGNLVLDPVTVSSTGVSLVQGDAADTIKKHLFPLAKVITPNIYEALLFTGVSIHDEESMKNAATILRKSGPEAIVITGGHLQNRATDLLFDGMDFLFFQREKIEGDFHGTGCVFSSAITAGLALGYDVREATVNANDFVWKAIKSALSIGKGMKILNSSSPSFS
jgi:hydroxymethylpyrimidine/phosphomethylpyrimidine kinase